jgi:hypothetical protein
MGALQGPSPEVMSYKYPDPLTMTTYCPPPSGASRKLVSTGAAFLAPL